MTLLWVLAGAVTVVLATLGYFAWRMTRPPTVDFAPEWVAEFTPARYRPMERLLSEADFKFLSERTGIDAAAINRLKAERRRIFRSYLGLMNRDFTRLQTIGRLMVLYSPTDRSDLAEALIRQQLRFRLLWISMHARLVLHAADIGTLEMGSLLQPVRNLTGYIQAPQATAAAA